MLDPSKVCCVQVDTAKVLLAYQWEDLVIAIPAGMPQGSLWQVVVPPELQIQSAADQHQSAADPDGHAASTLTLTSAAARRVQRRRPIYEKRLFSTLAGQVLDVKTTKCVG